MKASASLDDLALFLAVSDAGSITGAARATGVSAPTLSRRMTQLERDRGARLFQRGRHGYALTAAGRALRERAAPLRDVQARLAAPEGPAAPRVRITAGAWTSRYLAQRITEVWDRDSAWVPEFLSSNAVTDIARREADIGVRNRRPEQAWLAGRRTAMIEYAVYGSGPGVQGFVTLPREAASTPSERWLYANHADEIVTTASDARLALELARAGVGRILLPVFAGEGEAGLRRLGAPIAALTHDEWLVSHHEARHDPPVRAGLEDVARLLTDRARREVAR